MAEPTTHTYQVNARLAIDTLEAGSGDPLLFLHGAGGLAWDPYLDALAARRRVIAPFLPGTSKSNDISQVRDLWDLVLCYYDLLDALDIGRADVVGHSMGGMIACEMAANDPSRVGRLIAIAPAGLFDMDDPMPDIFAMRSTELAERVLVDPKSPIAELLGAMPEDVDDQVDVLIQRLGTLSAAAKFLWPIPDKGLIRRLPRIKTPTQIIWGRQDGLIPVGYGDTFRDSIPGARLDVLDQASHLVQLERLPDVLALTWQALARPAGTAP
ncbi:alpha/beta fold hydrolase [Immundisolibacter sp.]|jgi:pimeloyl-ACP methyl ester carboxylesterase|uniref:alpha/beta fold hydrolase n=1 Tax=Immundisolibacter sp. TaxID=1934948 RepID=UPI000EC9D9B3|nr:alpha/beta hydrolase [Gammaproteobacteria bacterium]